MCLVGIAENSVTYPRTVDANTHTHLRHVKVPRLSLSPWKVCQSCSKLSELEAALHARGEKVELMTAEEYINIDGENKRLHESENDSPAVLTKKKKGSEIVDHLLSKQKDIHVSHDEN